MRIGNVVRRWSSSLDLSTRPTYQSRLTRPTTDCDQRLIFIIGKRAHSVKPLCGAPSATITVFLNSLEGLLYRHLERRLAQQIRGFLRSITGSTLPRIVIEQPPKVELGEYALPLAFELAKQLRRPPRKSRKRLSPGSGRSRVLRNWNWRGPATSMPGLTARDLLPPSR